MLCSFTAQHNLRSTQRHSRHVDLCPHIHQLQLQSHQKQQAFLSVVPAQEMHIMYPANIIRGYTLTLLYFLISRTKLLKASSTLIRCLAEVSINLHPKCFARSRPSA